MITKVIVDNFMGIEKKVTISGVANNKIKRSNNYYIKNNNNENILKTLCIIGSNGSGKTSLLKAIATIQTFVTFPYRKSSEDSKVFIEQIKKLPDEIVNKLLINLNTLSLPLQNVNNKSRNTSIELEVFVPQDSKSKNIISGIYNYKLIYNSNYRTDGIIEESLFYRKKLNSKKIIKIFEVKNILESELGTQLLYNNNNILSENEKIDYYMSFGKEIIDKFLFLFNTELFDYATGEQSLMSIIEEDKKRFVDLCNIADSKIVDAIIETKNGEKQIFFINNKNNKLSFEQLSSGTKKVILYGNKILYALENNMILFIDEIENSLHPKLALFLLQLMGYPIKKSYSQLFFTTHSFYLSSLLDNDQLYYIDNKNDNYIISNISNAIKTKTITKDKSLTVAIFEDLLINNPDENKIDVFLKNK